jgi:hypothetical protein
MAGVPEQHRPQTLADSHGSRQIRRPQPRAGRQQLPLGEPVAQLPG